MTARPFLASARHEEAEGGLTMMRRGRWHLVLVEVNGGRGGALVRCG
jgi:hypothetical protein